MSVTKVLVSFKTPPRLENEQASKSLFSSNRVIFTWDEIIDKQKHDTKGMQSTLFTNYTVI